MGKIKGKADAYVKLQKLLEDVPTDIITKYICNFFSRSELVELILFIKEEKKQ